MVKLGVNVDHVGTLREARGRILPDPADLAREAVQGGADSITVHLREDRRHIQDRDLWRIKRRVRRPLNLEMSVAEEIVQIACRLAPEKACLVPERRREVTTEGGLDAAGKIRRVSQVVSKLSAKGIEVSLFIDPDLRQVRASKKAGARAVELHTGAYANARKGRKGRELERLKKAAWAAHALGLRVHAGHGLDYGNVQAVAKIPQVRELNIGHAIVSRAVSVGMRRAVREMKRLCAIA